MRGKETRSHRCILTGLRQKKWRNRAAALAKQEASHFHVWSQSETHLNLHLHFTRDDLKASGWLTGFLHQSDASPSVRRVYLVRAWGELWVSLFDGWFPGWLVVFWMTDEADDLVECVCVPELIDRTPPQFTGWISKWPSLSLQCSTSLLALVSFFFLLVRLHCLSLFFFFLFFVPVSVFVTFPLYLYVTCAFLLCDTFLLSLYSVLFFVLFPIARYEYKDSCW